MKNMIFHIPMKLNTKQHSGSQIRPFRMIEAFEELAYHVEVVMGSAKQRAEQIRMIKEKIKKGVKYEFMYSESSTTPTLLTEEHHLPLHPFLDFDFFAFCREHNIRIGLFYRDVYWAFDEFRKDLSPLKRIISNFFYKYDLRKYNSLLEVLFLPSIKMYEAIPFTFDGKIEALPPGVKKMNLHKNKIDSRLAFIYVGGIGNVYDLRLFVETLSQQEQVRTILCTRKIEWEAVKCNYLDLLNENIEVEHLHGAALDQKYTEVDIAIYFLKPNALWDFAMGLKLFDYIARKKPILAIQGTAIGDFVEQNNIGWTIKYDKMELEETILKIQNNLACIEEKIKNIESILSKNTWLERANKVCNTLSNR